jgi:gluconokinase
VEELHGEHKNILVSGGFTRSENWIQILSNVLGKKLTLQEANDASAIGAALMGFNALKIDSHFASHPSNTFNPDSSAHQLYAKNYLIFRKLNSAVKEIF